MRALPIFDTPPSLPFESVTPLKNDSNCTKCSRAPIYTCCMRPIASKGYKEGATLIILSSPNREDDQAKRPLASKVGVFIKGIVEEVLGSDANVVYDHAVKCYDSKAVDSASITACLPYLANTINEVKPSRIIAMGRHAIEAITGEYLNPIGVRRGYAYSAMHNVPIFFSLGVGDLRGNYILKKRLQEDMAWCLTTPLPKPPQTNGYALIIQTEEDARKAAEDLLDQDIDDTPWLAFDCEWMGEIYTKSFRLLSVQLAKKGSKNGYVWGLEALQNKEAVDVLKVLLESNEVKIVGHFVKHDIAAVRCGLGVLTKGVFADTHVINKLIDVEAKNAEGGTRTVMLSGLGTLNYITGYGAAKDEMQEAVKEGKKQVIKALRKNSKTLWYNCPQDVDAELRAAYANQLKAKNDADKDEEADTVSEVIDKYGYFFVEEGLRDRYAAGDVVTTSALMESRYAELRTHPGLLNVFTEIAQPATTAIEQIEAWGVHIDPDAVRAFDCYINGEIKSVGLQFKPYGFDVDNPEKSSFNPNSGKQIADILYNKLKLPVTKRTEKGAPSTDKQTLLALAEKFPEHEICATIVKWLHINKMKSSYLTAIVREIREDGRAHPDFDITGARTGRLSAHYPALQTIPRADSIIGKLCRSLFAVPEGYTMVEADYSQLELRVAAMLSEDDVMLALFESGVDFHLGTAKLISQVAWGIAEHMVEKKHRSLAKAVNFGLAYGKGVKTLARELKIPVEQAQKIVDLILGKFKKFIKWRENRVRISRDTGYTCTYWNGKEARRRQLFHIGSQDDAEVSNATNASYNTIIQGTGSDYCTKSAVVLVDWIIKKKFPAKVTMLVHDAIISEVKDGYVEEYIEKKKEIMTNHYFTPGKLAVDVKVGKSWGTLVDYHKEAA